MWLILEKMEVNKWFKEMTKWLNGHWASAEESQNSWAVCPCTVCLLTFCKTSFEFAELAPHSYWGRVYTTFIQWIECHWPVNSSDSFAIFLPHSWRCDKDDMDGETHKKAEDKTKNKVPSRLWQSRTAASLGSYSLEWYYWTCGRFASTQLPWGIDNEEYHNKEGKWSTTVLKNSRAKLRWKRALAKLTPRMSSSLTQILTQSRGFLPFPRFLGEMPKQIHFSDAI